MADRSHRFLRRALAVCYLIAAACLPAGPSPTSSADTVEPTILRALQMNLCNSGRASCYTGQSLARAAEVISAEAPDLVTLNEICQDDVTALERVFATVHSGRTAVSAFQAARDRPSGGDTRCRNGQPYGVGLLTHVQTPDTPHAVYRGIHPTQDLADPEERPWLCVNVDSVLLACTTHLAATSYRVALAQCGHLLNTILPTIRRHGGYAPTVLSGDLNLRDGGYPDVRSCTPPDHQRIDDGALQHIIATFDIRLCCRKSLVMRGATDHPGLLATLSIDGSRPGRPPT
ncbi:endonuclease/exonuclease/phosphatase family metal-dependent hydrolase [Micromonospora luteifusca]|uniref:Endonuclease/exonuclease/phosphatase family metal-dependent hydrolase n=1 Tax=Micromonospora luteifusca TaxID=709860 RepID=A0ABS2M3L8_9ACTN|nr:endonuclease/exonuclease/phosphatase family protein [Micromonospora luteifusca]MBM7495032.1 endonuclease/exonuclease/phosphatase family metal-dependent hydrolase [Micromonospora luteifusca]